MAVCRHPGHRGADRCGHLGRNYLLLCEGDMMPTFEDWLGGAALAVLTGIVIWFLPLLA
jgi:hypothetical protein